MDRNYRLQIPINAKTKKTLEKKAEEEGFASSTDLVRLLVHKFLLGEFKLQIVSSVDNIPMLDIETERRIHTSIQEINNGEYDLIDFKSNPRSLRNLYQD